MLLSLKNSGSFTWLLVDLFTTFFIKSDIKDQRF